MELSRNRLALVALAGVAISAGTIAIALKRAQAERASHPPDDAPGRTARRSRFGGYRVVGQTVTVNRPRSELYRFWREFENLPRFMEDVREVRQGGQGRTTWTIAGPAGRTVTLETTVVQERPDELIAWRLTPDSQIDAEGRITFREAPGGRGTQVGATVAYKPPLGELGRLAAKIFQREPAIQARRELKRFKMLMEAGEIATPANRTAQA